MLTLTINKNSLVTLPANPKRSKFYIVFTPSSIAAGNTGKIFVGRGFTPVATVGDPNQGDVLNAGSEILETAQYSGDPNITTTGITIVSDTDGQQITIDDQAFP